VALKLLKVLYKEHGQVARLSIFLIMKEEEEKE
jgi:hypothetical protein